MRFRERIRALHLDGILRRQHEKRQRQYVPDTPGGDLIFLHRLQQRRLSLWRRAVDLVRQNHVRENRPFNECHLSAAGVLLQDFHARDVRRHQVWRELDALKLQMKYLRDGLYQQRLGQARCSGDQAMSAGKQRDQDLFDHLLLPNNHFLQLALNSRPTGNELLHQFLFRILHILY